MVTHARAALETAIAMAQAGAQQDARELCATVVFDAQPMFAACPDLLRTAVYALLMARGFQLLSRLVLAMSGRRVRLVMAPAIAGPTAPPRGREEPGRTTYALDQRWLDRLTADDLLFRHWCDAFITRRQNCTAMPGIAPASRHLAPA
jgi:hypothetical protein